MWISHPWDGIDIETGLWSRCSAVPYNTRYSTSIARIWHASDWLKALLIYPSGHKIYGVFWKHLREKKSCYSRAQHCIRGTSNDLLHHKHPMFPLHTQNHIYARVSYEKRRAKDGKVYSNTVSFRRRKLNEYRIKCKDPRQEAPSSGNWTFCPGGICGRDRKLAPGLIIFKNTK